ncbi:MAG: hypothetical protein NZ898_15130 [Myxococcota bacterium]|nr:hypothetical protein [Myxococcota bacterium]MDW8363161.1 hypothetical protein [Myxococcales bacterium]
MIRFARVTHVAPIAVSIVVFGCNLLGGGDEPPSQPVVTVQQQPSGGGTTVNVGVPGAGIVATEQGDEQRAVVGAGGAGVHAVNSPEGQSAYVGVPGGGIQATNTPSGQHVNVGGPGGIDVQRGPQGSTIRIGGLTLQVPEGTGRPAPGAGPANAPSNAPGAPPATAPSPPPVPSQPTTSAPLVCDGNDDVVRSNVLIDGGDGPAVRASGNCDLRCVNCTLRSRGTAVEVSGNAKVTLERCRVSGGQRSVSVTANGELMARSSVLEGPTHRGANAELRIVP